MLTDDEIDEFVNKTLRAGHPDAYDFQVYRAIFRAEGEGMSNNALSPQEMTETIARNVARIVGESSAAAQALRHLDNLRASGQFAYIEQHGNSWRELLVAASPFDSSETLTGCPQCRQCSDGFSALCDEPGCVREVSCGTPTPTGYRNTCGEHRP